MPESDECDATASPLNYASVCAIFGSNDVMVGHNQALAVRDDETLRLRLRLLPQTSQKMRASLTLIHFRSRPASDPLLTLFILNVIVPFA